MADKTPTEEYSLGFYRGQRETFKFLRMVGPRYVRNSHNNSALKEEIEARGLAWTAENLIVCYEALAENCVLDDTPDPVAPVVEAPKEEPQPAGNSSWGELTRKRIDEMSAEDYRRFYKNPDFRAEVEALQIPAKGYK